jgi:hypothetical protein
VQDVGVHRRVLALHPQAGPRLDDGSVGQALVGLRAGRFVEVRVAHPVGSGETVTCVIPGHERTGREVIADSLDVSDEALEFSFRGNCGYESDFDYSG